MLASAALAGAQEAAEIASGAPTARDPWELRVLQRIRLDPTCEPVESGVIVERPGWSQDRVPRRCPVGQVMEVDAPRVPPILVEVGEPVLADGAAPLEPIPMPGSVMAPAPAAPGCDCGGTDAYADPRRTWEEWDDAAGGTCRDLEAWSAAHERGTLAWWLRDLSVFGGVHGFKGPFDLGRNGNFGFHEGLNLGAPVGLCDWGWQLGLEATHSNLSGDRVLDSRQSNRCQFFFTGGLFRRRADWGFQWGVTYDWLHDEYYARTDLKQIRSDTSFLFPGGWHELGYFGAYGTGGTNVVLVNRELKYYIFMEPTDIFAFYYRRYFTGGGDGRLWVGFSGNGDGIVGAELRVPIGTSWALENRVNYLIPKEGRGIGGASEESWGVTIDLVWYPLQASRCVRYHPYRPMLNVADNTLFMTDTFVPPPVHGR